MTSASLKKSWFTRCFTQFRRPHTIRNHPGCRFHPRIEALEDRVTPADIITLTGTAVTHDESFGLQTSGVATTTEDNNDDDVAVPASLDTMPFSTRLFGAGGLGLNKAAAIGAAQSDGNVIDIDPGTSTLVDVGFTDANGNPLNGLDSGLLTLADNGIFLYTDTENNIVLGREGSGAAANPAGDVVFAVVLGETLTGAEIWIVQFEAIKHPDGSNFDDAVDLANKLFVEASTEFIFSDFSKAPSGQNDWLGFGPTGATADVQILVTGKTPTEVDANQAGDTVNTSTIGLGTNSQAVDPTEGLRIDFVSGLNLPPQAGGDNDGDTKNMFGIDYNQHVETTGAGFQIVQIQGNAKNRVNANVSIFNTTDAEGADFIDPGFSQQVAVNIGLVEILNSTSQVVARWLNGVQVIVPGGDNKVEISVAGNTASVVGLLTNYSVVVRSANGVLFDRMLVVNAHPAGTNTKGFDLGGIRLLDVRADLKEVGSKVRFEDDGPVVDVSGATDPALTVDETNLAINATGDFAPSFTSEFGTDVGGTTNISYALEIGAGDTGLFDTATGQKVVLSINASGVVEGRTDTSNDLVFTISVNTTSGIVTLDQIRALVHPTPGASHDESVVLQLDSLIKLTATVTDADGDNQPVTLDIAQTFVFKDDGPSITGTVVGAPTLTVDETDLATNDSASFAAQFTPVFGADGQGATPVGYALGIGAGATGLVDTATGQAVVLSVVGGVVEGRTAISDELVFTVSVDSNGNVTLDQIRAMVHPDPTNHDESISLAAGLVTLTATATDKDNDTAAATINIGNLLAFEDDGPSVSLSLSGGVDLTVDDTDLPTESDSDTAANLFTTSANFGADGAAAGSNASVWSLAPVSAGADSGLDDVATGSNILLFQNGANSVVGRVGSAIGAVAFTVSIDAATGAVTLDLDRAIKHPDATDPDDELVMASGLINVTRTVTDKDGDTDAASDSISEILRFRDDGPSVSIALNGTPTLIVDETNLGVSDADTAANLFIVSDDFGADESGASGNTYALEVGPDPSGLVDTQSGLAVTLAKDGDDIVGSAGGQEVFRISIDSATGAVTLNQSRAVVHPDDTDPNDVVSLAANSVLISRTITDKDGDTDSDSVAAGSIFQFVDDGPSDITTTDTSLENKAGQSATNDLDFLANVGNDKAGDVVFEGTDGTVLQGSIGGDPLANLTSGGDTIYLFGFGTNTLVATTNQLDPTDSSSWVFTITLNPSGDDYTTNILKPIDNAVPLIFNDFSGVPSGQQEWIGLNDPRPPAENENKDILFTGKDPTKDTVNTSQTGLGSNNQSVNPGEAIRVDFVTGLNVIGGDFKDLSDMSHAGHYSVDLAGFLVSQTQSGSPVKVRVTIFDEKNASSDPATDLTNDAAEAIKSIKVVSATGDVLFEGSTSGTGLSGIIVTFSADRLFVDVQGLLAGMKVVVSAADGGFNRLLVENIGTKGFDLGGVVIEQIITPDPIVMNFDLSVLDEDGDGASGSIQLTLTAPTQASSLASSPAQMSSLAADWGSGAALMTSEPGGDGGVILHGVAPSPSTDEWGIYLDSDDLSPVEV